MIPNSTRLRHPLLLILVTLLSATLTVTLVPAASAAIGNHQTLTASTTTTTWPTLRYGARGSAVVYLQQRLTALHYDVGGVDGVFGSNTLHAVYAFQKVQAISVDGIVSIYRRIEGWHLSPLGWMWRPTTSTAATRCTGPIRRRPTRPAMAASASRCRR